VADGLYVGMAGAAARAAQLEAVADNLANAETPGFRAARPAFQSFMRGRTDKVSAAAVATGIDLRPGVTAPTDAALDVVPEGDLYLGVELLGGRRGYTRNGHIEVGPEGDLIIGGNRVISAAGAPLSVPPGASPTLDEDGNVIVDGAVADTLGLFRVDGPLERNGPALLTLGPGATAEAIEGTLRIGELEIGNVGSLESTVAMITAHRQFETAMQAIETYRKMDERANEMGRVR